MITLREVEEAIHELEQGSATYNNCMKLAALYTIRKELSMKEGGYNNYTMNSRSTYGTNNNYGYRPAYYPYYNTGRGGNGNSSYGYDRPMNMNYTDEDLLIRPDHLPEQEWR